jgi:ABC-type spermidine/putrescine transport system permease subunit II
MIFPSVLEKVSYGIALAVLYSQHRLPLSVLVIGSGDWIFALLFLAAYFTTKSGRAPA